MTAGQVSSAIRRAGVAALGVGAIGLVAGGGWAAAQTAKPAADCQPYQTNPCPLMFPDNRFTKPDKSSATGIRVHLKQKVMPQNTAGKRINVGPYDRAD